MTSLSRIGRSRRDFITSSLGSPNSILEVGAFDNPVYRRELGDPVKYVDWFSHEELAEMHGDNPRRDNNLIVDVDFVVKDRHIAHAISEKFDLICASHVIEHIPDVIFWFAELDAMLANEGRVFLAIPDRRYTFDYFRPASRATELIRAYEEKIERPAIWQLADHFYYHQKVDLAALWRQESPGSFTPRFSLSQAMDLARAKANTYTDCHCWTFTADSFGQMLADLESSGLCPFTIEKITPPLPNTNEFFALLRRASDS